MSIGRLIEHLLPCGLPWRLADNSVIRAITDGLGAALDDVRLYADLIFLDLFPETTRCLDEWEHQFGLPAVASLTEQQRRERLAVEWRLIGGQSIDYLQDIMQAAGFPVYFHEWWEDTTPTPRDPRLHLRGTYQEGAGTTSSTMGNPEATMGNPEATMNVVASIQAGYVLVNKTFAVTTGFSTTMGNPEVTMGNPDATMGGYEGGDFEERSYDIPGNPDLWPYFLYVGAETFGEAVDIPLARRDEFENLLLKICPAQQWLGLFVRYTSDGN